MNFDADYWNQRYLTADAPWNLGRPSAPLTAYLDSLPNRDLRILIPGGGAGHEAAYALRIGFKNMVVLDWSEEAVAGLRAAHPDVAVVVADFFSHAGQYDLMLEQTFFCALSPPQRPDYARKAAELLAPGGRLAGVWFDFPLTEKGPPFGGSAEEYRALMAPYFDLRVLGPCFNSEPERAGKELFILAEKAT